jgi:hypothetical protein
MRLTAHKSPFSMDLGSVKTRFAGEALGKPAARVSAMLETLREGDVK